MIVAKGSPQKNKHFFQVPSLRVKLHGRFSLNAIIYCLISRHLVSNLLYLCSYVPAFKIDDNGKIRN
jgi:hypothetical protein